MNNDKMITIVKVVTRNFIDDFFAKINNIIGRNLGVYEKMIQKAISQIKDDLDKDSLEVSWFRYETTQLTNGAVSVLFYGELK